MDIHKPDDWGVSPRDNWVSFEELKDNGAPALEGRDIISFSSIKLAPGKPPEATTWKDVEGRQVSKNPQTGKWILDKQPSAAQRMEQARKSGQWKGPTVKEKAKTHPVTKPVEVKKEVPEQEQKPEAKKDKEQVQKKPQVSEGQNKNFDGSVSVGDMDLVTQESLNRVEEISATPSDDSRFDSGREANKKFIDHFSSKSKFFEGLQVLSKSLAVANNRDKVNNLIDAVKKGDLEREIPLTQKQSRSVKDLLSAAGINTEDADELKKFTDAYDSVTSFINDNGKWKTGETHELTGSSLGYAEAQYIAKREDLLKENPNGIQTKAFSLSSERQSDLANLDPRLTEAIYHLLPSPSREALAKSGSPKTFYDPTAPNEQGKNANPIRGAASLHMWTMQDGISAYSLSGQRRSPGEFQVEHIVPLKSGGSDHINNFTLILRRENEPRADLPFNKFLEQAKNKATDVKSDLNDPEVKEEFEKRYRAASFNAELAPVLGGSVGDLMNDSIVSGVNMGLEKGLGAEGAANLKFSPDNWEKYKSDLGQFLEKNRINPDSDLSSLSSDQLNGVFDIMGGQLGVEKEKMMEYLGRNLYNNYDLGIRFIIDKKTGEIQEGRGGTAPTSGALLNMQNLVLADDKVSGDALKSSVSTIKENHQNLKKARSEFIRNPNNLKAYEKYMESVVNNISYLTGTSNDSPFSGRDYDNRFTASNRNNIHSDTANAILNLLSLDTASVSGGKDVLSPGKQNNLTEKAKEHSKTLANFLISSYVKTSGLTPEQIKNPDSLTKTKRKPIEPLLAALENLGRAINS